MKHHDPAAFTFLDRLARGIDVYRLVPRIALGGYMIQMWRVGEWAMNEPDLSTPQTVFISTLYGVFPLLLNFYMQQGNNWMPPGFTAAPAPPSVSIAATASTGQPQPLAKGN